MNKEELTKRMNGSPESIDEYILIAEDYLLANLKIDREKHSEPPYYALEKANMLRQINSLNNTNTQLVKEIEELKKKTEWISVEDKLPNEFTSVLVVGGDIRSCALYRDKKFYTDFPLPTNEEITHWMPLPNPPKQ